MLASALKLMATTMILLVAVRGGTVSTSVANPPVDTTTTAYSPPQEPKHDEGHSVKQNYPKQDNYYAPNYGHNAYGPPPRQESAGYGRYGQYGSNGDEYGRYGAGYAGYGSYGSGFGGSGFGSYGRGGGGGYGNNIGGGIGRFGGAYGGGYY